MMSEIRKILLKNFILRYDKKTKTVKVDESHFDKAEQEIVELIKSSLSVKTYHIPTCSFGKDVLGFDTIENAKVVTAVNLEEIKQNLKEKGVKIK